MNKNSITMVAVLLLIVIGILFYKNNLKEKNPSAVIDPNAIVSTRTSSDANVPLYLTDTKGRALYVFADDSDLKSSCSGECLKSWPVFEYDNKYLSQAKDPLSKRINIITREDGYRQYAYGTKPLYYFSGDLKAGDVNGNGLEGKWSLVPIFE